VEKNNLRRSEIKLSQVVLSIALKENRILACKNGKKYYKK